MKKDLFAEVLVGVFMTAVLALLAYFTIVISGVDLLAGREKTAVVVEFTDVGGLKERDNVVYRGMKVGVVERIELGGDGIRAMLRVDSDVVLRESCRVSVAPLSLLGGNCLVLEEGTGAVVPLSGKPFRGSPPLDWMRDLGEIARKLNTLTSGPSLANVISNFDSVAAKANVVVSRLERGEGTLGKLLSTNDAVWADVADTAASARAAAASIRTLAARVERGEGTVGKLLSSDDALYRDVSHTFASAAEIAGRLAKGEGTMGKLLSTNDVAWADFRRILANVRAATDRLAEGKGLAGRLVADDKLADDAGRLVANLSAVSERLAKGEGTLGKLTADRELYDEVNGLVRDVRQVVDNYRDTTPISTFGSLIMGGL